MEEDLKEEIERMKARIYESEENIVSFKEEMQRVLVFHDEEFSGRIHALLNLLVSKGILKEAEFQAEWRKKDFEFMDSIKKIRYDSLDKESNEILRKFYLDLRSRTDIPINISIRHYEMLLRTAEAVAKLNSREKVTKEDVSIVVEVVKTLMKERFFDW